jgi:hypothetical protein
MMPTVLAMRQRRRARNRRLMRNFLLVLRVLLSLPRCPGHISASLRRQRTIVRELQARMTREQWIRTFRMELSHVMELFALIADDLYVDQRKAFNSSGSAIQPEVRLLMAIRWCAGASYLDLMIIFGVSKALFFQSLWRVFTCLVNRQPVVLKLGEDACRQRSEGFLARQRQPVFKHAIGAVDGILVACRCPYLSEYPRPVQFWTRKGYFAFNVQAMCDAARRITFISMDCPGSCHDSVALSMSTLGQHLVDIPQPYYILADPAYKGFDRMLVPFEGRGRNEMERNFNFFQSSLRMNIECTFGLLVARWGVLWRPLRASMANNILTIRTLAVLHNWCQDRRAVPISAPGGGRRGARLEERPYIDNNGVPGDMLAGDRANPGDRVEPHMHGVRKALARAIRDLRMRRPNTSAEASFRLQ